LLYMQQGEYADAEELYVEALAAKRGQLGDDHPHTLTSMSDLGMLYMQQSKYFEADRLLTTAFKRGTQAAW
jgi:hypothetical protein